MRVRSTMILILAFFVAGPAWAQSLEEALSGFDDAPPQEAPAIEEPPPASADEKIYVLTGSVSLKGAWNYAHEEPAPGATDYRGLSRLRGELNLAADLYLPKKWRGYISGRGFYDGAYELNGRDDYTEETLDTYETELEFREGWIRGEVAKNLDLKIGRQIVVWGKADNVRVTDLLNPLDNREPGMVDIEDLRLPVLMTRLDYYTGPFQITAVAIHERRFDKRPSFGSDFWPYPFPPPDEELPGEGFDETEWAAAIEGRFEGWDLSFYAADLYNDQPHLLVTGVNRTPDGRMLPTLLMQHARIKLIGAAGAVAAGNWLIKGEGAYLDGLAFGNAPDESFARVDLMAGIEYTGITDAMIGVEVVIRTLQNYNEKLAQAPDMALEEDVQVTARYSQSFFREKLEVMALFSRFDSDGKGGGFERLSASWELAEGLNISGGFMMYVAGERLFTDAIGDNDRLFLDLVWSFTR